MTKRSNNHNGHHRSNGDTRVRYAVVGLGYIAQAAVLPAFKQAENSRLTALVSDEPAKLRLLGRKYGVSNLYSYAEYDECLQSGEIDAVYVALPNSMHAKYTVRAAKAGIHILCEKPMAVTARECRQMIRAVEKNDVRLMIAYRLHFEAANMKAVEIAKSGKIGDLRIFNSLFTMQVKPGDIRLKKKLGGGSLYDIGIYCLNAARYLFRSEPTEVFAYSEKNKNKRFAEVDEMTAAVLRFPDERLATFTSSFGAADTASYELVGTKGTVRLDPAFETAADLKMKTKIGERTSRHEFDKRDQFAPELIHFSDCIQRGSQPKPSGEEGLIDVRIIEALYKSARKGKPVKIEDFGRIRRPDSAQALRRPPIRKPRLIHAKRPHS